MITPQLNPSPDRTVSSVAQINVIPFEASVISTVENYVRSGAFYGFTFESGEQALIGGFVRGSTAFLGGSPNIIKVPNISLRRPKGDFLGKPGEYLFLEIQGVSDIESGEDYQALIPSFNVIAVNVRAGLVPNHQLPTVKNPSGIFNYPIGVFDDGDFIANFSGNVLVAYCPGYFQVFRE